MFMWKATLKAYKHFKVYNKTHLPQSALPPKANSIKSILIQYKVLTDS